MTFMENEVGRYAIYRIADGDFSHLWVNGKEIKDFSDSGNTGMNLQLKNTRILQYCYTKNYTNEGADKILDYYRASKGAFLCIQKNKRILHYGYIIKQSL